MYIVRKNMYLEENHSGKVGVLDEVVGILVSQRP